ncbi:MAG: UvrD-helicase domain-containing protein [Burkholderiaceae bacterium]|nr:UvrD-helicase domain-containing protein [Burkholderiaceae bacterium]
MLSVVRFLEGLNPPQLAAVTESGGHVLVLAGAGSGKTRVLTTRIAWLMQQGRVGAAQILAVTFTNKAAREMIARIEAMLPIGTRAMWIGTFHGLCNRMLRAHYRDAQLPSTFQILDSQDQLSAIKRLLKTAGVDEVRCPPREVQMFINGAKEAGLRARDLASEGSRDRLWVELFDAYDRQCQREGAVDFAELLLRSYELLARNEPLRLHYQQRFRHILIDEFQDTNVLQYRWLKLLAGPESTLFAVGDDDQSIYRFRGANVGNMADFEREFAASRVIKLEQNYRSFGHILDAANCLIRHNTQRLGKNLWTGAGQGERAVLFEADSDGLEASWVVEQARELIDSGARPSDVAVLYRSNAQSRILEHALFIAGLPYRVYGGLRFFERAEVKNALAYLRLTNNPYDDASFVRAVNFPPRGIGARTLEQLQDAAAAGRCSLYAAIGSIQGRTVATLAPFAQLIEELRTAAAEQTLPDLVALAIQQSGLAAHYRQERDGQERVQNLEELVNAATGFAQEEAFGGAPAAAAVRREGEQEQVEPLAAFLAHASLEAGDNQAGQGQDALQLMTVHSAKGLEFEAVFITGLEEGLFPHDNSLSEGGGLEEERRLMYVAITRARRRLFLSLAQSRLLHGQTRYGIRSRFLEELPAESVRWLAPRRSRTPAALSAWAMPPPAATSAAGGDTGHHGLRVGQLVRHSKFGDGVVLRLQGAGADARAQIQFSSAGTKELLLSVAKLEAA